MSGDRAGSDLKGHFDANYLVRDGRIWYLRRRVPAGARAYDQRKEVYISTRTADRGAALVIAQRLNAELEQYWRGLVEDAAPAAAHRFSRAVKTARKFGVTYQPASEVSALPAASLVERVVALEGKVAPAGKAAPVVGNPVVAAVLGGAEAPVVRLSGLYAAFEELAGDRLAHREGT